MACAGSSDHQVDHENSCKHACMSEGVQFQRGALKQSSADISGNSVEDQWKVRRMIVKTVLCIHGDDVESTTHYSRFTSARIGGDTDYPAYRCHSLRVLVNNFTGAVCNASNVNIVSPHQTQRNPSSSVSAYKFLMGTFAKTTEGLGTPRQDVVRPRTQHCWVRIAPCAAKPCIHCS